MVFGYKTLSWGEEKYYKTVKDGKKLHYHFIPPLKYFDHLLFSPHTIIFYYKGKKPQTHTWHPPSLPIYKLYTHIHVSTHVHTPLCLLHCPLLQPESHSITFTHHCCTLSASSPPWASLFSFSFSSFLEDPFIYLILYNRELELIIFVVFWFDLCLETLRMLRNLDFHLFFNCFIYITS